MEIGIFLAKRYLQRTSKYAKSTYKSVCNFQIGLYILKISCTASTLENKSSLYIYIYNETLLKYKDEPKEDISHQATTRWVFLLTACLSSNDSQ